MVAAALGANKMVWPFLMGGATVLVGASWAVGNGHALKCSALILSGFVGARVILAPPINSEYLDVIFAAMWVVIATSLPIAYDNRLVPSVVIKLLIAGAALCSLWGRLSHYNMHFGSLPYATADLLVIAAMLWIGWSLRHDVINRVSEFFDRGSGVVGDTAFYSRGPVDYPQSLQDCSESQKVSSPKVRAHG